MKSKNTIIRKLIAKGIIKESSNYETGYYAQVPVNTRPVGRKFSKGYLISYFTSFNYSTEEYSFNTNYTIALDFLNNTTRETITPVLKKLHKMSYQSQARNVEQAISRIQADNDNVKRTFGLEWEIYSLTAQQEHNLCNLLETLPAHCTESDGSLSSSGVEIVFEPMNKTTFLTVWNKLKEFTNQHNIDMNGTGAHITYGVSNSTVEQSDLNIRLNRIGTAIHSVLQQSEIREIFGRLPNNYAALTLNVTDTNKYRFAKARNANCFELRLVNHAANITKVMTLLSAMELAFNSRFGKESFIAIANAVA